MSKATGELAVAIPLYRRHEEQELGNLKGFSVSISDERPIAYVLDLNCENAPIVNAAIAHEKLEFLGDL